MDSIVIGRYSFSVEFLTSNTKKEAVEKSKHIKKSIVEEAWNKANPRKRKTTRKKEGEG